MTVDQLQSLGYMANWSARLFARAVETRLKPLGLSPGQLPLFFALAANAPMSQKSLCQIIGIEQPTMAATLARMERDGLVARKPDPQDGRSSFYFLTAKASKHAMAIERVVQDINGVALDGISEADRQIVLRVLNSAVKSMKIFLAETSDAPKPDVRSPKRA